MPPQQGQDSAGTEGRKCQGFSGSRVGTFGKHADQVLKYTSFHILGVTHYAVKTTRETDFYIHKLWSQKNLSELKF